MGNATPEGFGRREPDLLAQTVVVIGGSAGIGFETARRARAEGAEVILTGRDPERLQRAGRELGARSTAAFDATDFGQLGRFFADLPNPIDAPAAAAAHPGSPSSRRSRRRIRR